MIDYNELLNAPEIVIPLFILLGIIYIQTAGKKSLQENEGAYKKQLTAGQILINKLQKEKKEQWEQQQRTIQQLHEQIDAAAKKVLETLGYTELVDEENNLINELETEKHKVQSLTNELTESHNVTTQIDNENKNLKKELADLKSHLQEASTLFNEKELALKTQMESLNNKLAALTKSDTEKINTLQSKNKEQEHRLTQTLSKLQLTEAELKALTLKVKWVYVAETDLTIGYRGYLPGGDILKPEIILIKKSNLKAMPVSIQGQEETFEDGDHYPISLMDFARGGKQHNIELKDTKGNSKPTTNKQRVRVYIEEHPGSIHKELADGLGIDRSNLSKLLKSLEIETIISRKGDQYYIV